MLGRFGSALDESSAVELEESCSVLPSFHHSMSEIVTSPLSSRLSSGKGGSGEMGYLPGYIGGHDIKGWSEIE